VEILRFGPGFRHAPPTPGTQGLAIGTIWSDPRLRVTELSFAQHSLIAPQSSPDDGLFIVIAGGGWVQVGAERGSINHGEAVAWPADQQHAAWTAGSTMRAVLVEVPTLATSPGAARGPLPHVVDLHRDDAAGDPTDATGARAGSADSRAAHDGLAARELPPEDHDASQGEPW
jgi:quercetin dioxygenase-like cupin family protein